MNLVQESNIGQEWYFNIEDGDQYTVTSNSIYFKYILTNDSLIIIADKKAKDGDTITFTKGDTTFQYVLDKSQIQEPEEQENIYTLYYGSTNENIFESGTPVTFTSTPTSVTFLGDKRYVWVTVPNNCRVTTITETDTGTWVPSSMINVNDNTYYLDTEVTKPNTEYKFKIE